MFDQADIQLQLEMYKQLLELEFDLENYQPYFAVKADFLIRTKQIKKARGVLHQAISLTNNKIEINYLTNKLNQLK
ncbi:MAG: hypothetical protein HRU28_12135 [Rhizobiales bacterium]|nr:hypothetical protein [Hyphomicrobiales bacterium]